MSSGKKNPLLTNTCLCALLFTCLRRKAEEGLKQALAKDPPGRPVLRSVGGASLERSK